MAKKITAYLSKHVMFNSMIHLLGGVGLGIILADPLFLPHPLRWGIFFIALALLGHLYALKTKR